MRRVTLAVLLATAASSAQAALPADFKAKADALLAKSYRADQPGAVVVVYEKGKPVYAVGRGLADMAAKAPLTPATPMRLGSITKQFTAAVVMQMVDEKKLSLDDKLSKFLPDFPTPGADVTVRQLLNHTSGIKSYTSLPDFWLAHLNTPTTTDDVITAIRNEKATFPAGSDWVYNNSGYVLLGAIIEKVSGRAWHEEVDRRIAKPLKLASLRYGGGTGGEAGMAKGYRVVDGKAELAQPMHMSFAHAAGALVSNAGDLARWAYALHHGKVVSAPSYQQMISKTTLPSGRVVDYGFGLIPEEVRGHATIAHDGGINGFSTDSRYIPDRDVFIAVLGNTERPQVDPEDITRKLAALAVGDPFEEFTAEPIETAKLAMFEGIYKAEGVERAFFVKDGKMFTRRTDRDPIEVLYGGKGRFFYADATSWFTFEKGEGGKPVMSYHTDGAKRATAMTYAGPIPSEAPVIALPRPALERLVGKYDGPMPIVVAIDEAGKLTLKFGGQDITHLLPETPTLFRVEEVNAKIRFGEKDGKVMGLAILQGGREMKAARAD